mgnify:CR=1 FL=1
MRRCVGSPRTWASSAARCASGRPGTLPGVRPAPTAGRRPARCVHAGPTTPGRAGRRRRLPGRRSRAWRRRTLSLTLRPSSPARGAGGIPSAGGRACLAGGDDPIEPVPRFVENHRDAYEVKRLRAGRGGGARHFTAPASNRRYVGDIPPLRGRCPLLPAPGRRDEPVPGHRHRPRTAGWTLRDHTRNTPRPSRLSSRPQSHTGGPKGPSSSPGYRPRRRCAGWSTPFPASDPPAS